MCVASIHVFFFNQDRLEGLNAYLNFDFAVLIRFIAVCSVPPSLDEVAGASMASEFQISGLCILFGNGQVSTWLWYRWCAS